jgi:hypothetical protein
MLSFILLKSCKTFVLASIFSSSLALSWLWAVNDNETNKRKINKQVFEFFIKTI